VTTLPEFLDKHNPASRHSYEDHEYFRAFDREGFIFSYMENRAVVKMSDFIPEFSLTIKFIGSYDAGVRVLPAD
jgi:hypothetical protein